MKFCPGVIWVTGTKYCCSITTSFEVSINWVNIRDYLFADSFK